MSGSHEKCPSKDMEKEISDFHVNRNHFYFSLETQRIGAWILGSGPQ